MYSPTLLTAVEEVGLNPELVGTVAGATVVAVLLKLFGSLREGPPTVGPLENGATGRQRAVALALMLAPALILACYYRWYVTAVEPLDPLPVVRGGLAGIGAALFSQMLASPIIEEFLFRKLLLDEFSRVFRRPMVAAAVNGVWFGGFHTPQVALAAMLAGTAIAGLRLQRAPLRFCIYSHVLANAAALLASGG